MKGVVEVTGRRGTRAATLSTYLDAASEQRAQLDACAWIKRLRAVRVDGLSMRARFTAGEDSLWWFTELYLHKEQAILAIMRTIAAIDALVERERPSSVVWRDGDAVTGWVAAARVARHGLTADAQPTAAARLARTERRIRVRAHALRLADTHPSKRTGLGRADVAAFVHRAFVNPAEGAAAGERYIGRVLACIEQRLRPGALQTLVLGPRRSFRTRRWWDPIVGRRGDLVAIESLGSSRSERDRTVWAARHDHLAALEASDELRQHAIVDGTDCWPVLHAQLVGVVWLQWPWSVRSMDRAAMAFDEIQPRVAVTYAEAGGWGRALALEARRRRTPLVGIQHGFIYRHWLNYLHEPDELSASREHPGDAGFPRPDRTLVFDRYAYQHLVERAHFPSEAIEVVGSAERDALVETVRGTAEHDRAAIRERLGIAAGRRVLLCATKFTDARDVLPRLATAVRSLDSLHMIIKAHPAEGTEGYAPFVSDNVSVVPAAEPLGLLLAIADAVVTVNSTVAVDALLLGIPALSIGQPNNLLPLVEAGAMLGANDEREIAHALSRLVADEQLRSTTVAKGRALVGVDVAGNATENAARAILAAAAPPLSAEAIR
jgi:hypothetical protein